jgi:signal peptidase I
MLESEAKRVPSRALQVSSLLRDAIIALFLAVILVVFLYQPVRVEGTSMMPGLHDQEHIFINKFTYKFNSIERGDTVVFWFPLDRSKVYIKRIIGLPGDLVQIDRGEVIVNGKALKEPYVPDEYRDHVSVTPYRIPPENYFVLGDHRSSSNDSRSWGTVERHFIYGKAVFVYWPVERIGTLH